MMTYSNPSIHKLMLKDALRTEAYREAIQQVVKPTDTVIDFGCGTGILSLFAADAGAQEVYAIDQSKFIRVARKIARKNGYGNIKFFYGDESEFHLSEKANVIVSEWMGHFALVERMFAPLVNIRNRNLKRNGTMIPQEIFLTAGFVCDPEIYRDLAYFQSEPYDIDFSFIGDWLFNQTLVKRLTPKQVLEQTIPLASLDMQSIQNIPKLSGSIVIEKSVTVHAICGWFDACLAENLFIKTGPFDPVTHWKHIIFPLNSPLNLSAGERVTVTIKPIAHHRGNIMLWNWVVATEDKLYDMNDCLHKAWTQRDLQVGWLE